MRLTPPWFFVVLYLDFGFAAWCKRNRTRPVAAEPGARQVTASGAGTIFRDQPVRYRPSIEQTLCRAVVEVKVVIVSHRGPPYHGRAPESGLALC
jgi:hypothetical protein